MRLNALHFLVAIGMVATLLSDPVGAQHSWQPQPDKAGLMVVSAHPDDEGIFFGGTLPYYTRVLDAPTVHVSMTSGDWVRPPEVREEELRNADWVYGLRNEPLFPRFKDAPTHAPGQNGGYLNSIDATWDWWNDGELDGYGTFGEDAAAGRQRAIDTMATYVRTYKPEVLVTHDLDGEYGHDNHKATAIAVVEAYYRAADPSYLDGLDPWQTKKLYVHFYGQNRLFHDFWELTSIDLSGNGMADTTPRRVADLGLDEHVSQGSPDVSTVYRTGENFDAWPSEWWGLYASTVGPDTIADPFTIQGTTYEGWARGDFLENIVSIPEPSALLLTGVGLPVLAFYGWRRRR
jgi:LmbE family N-acetylglucosaminyl deacetylase